MGQRDCKCTGGGVGVRNTNKPEKRGDCKLGGGGGGSSTDLTGRGQGDC